MCILCNWSEDEREEATDANAYIFQHPEEYPDLIITKIDPTNPTTWQFMSNTDEDVVSLLTRLINQRIVQTRLQ